MTTIRLVGQEKALDTLRVLSTDLQKKGVKSSLRVASKPVQEAMQGLAPDDSQTPTSILRAAINITAAKGGRKVRTGTGDRVVTAKEGEVALLVGPNKKVLVPKYNKSKKIAVGFIGWFAELGTKAHKIGSYLRFTEKVFASDGLSYTKTKFKLARRLKINGKFVTGEVQHPGTGAKRWMSNALASSQSRIESEFYSGLEKWVAKNGR